jgi:hypothetical protein
MMAIFALQDVGLVDLRGCPEEIDGDFYVHGNNLSSLAGGPKIVRNYYATDNNITSLKDIHKHIHVIGEDWHGGIFYLYNNLIKSNILGLLLIKGLREVVVDDDEDGTETHAMFEALEIVNSHLPNTEGKAGMIKCQNELIDAGLEEYAQL